MKDGSCDFWSTFPLGSFEAQWVLFNQGAQGRINLESFLRKTGWPSPHRILQISGWCRHGYFYKLLPTPDDPSVLSWPWTIDQLRSCHETFKLSLTLLPNPMDSSSLNSSWIYPSISSLEPYSETNVESSLGLQFFLIPSDPSSE